MKIFSTKFHGFLDYLVGIILLSMPAVLKLDYANIESQVFFALGGTLLFYSLLTNYELGLIRVLPMKVHLVLDILSGMFLAASPWVFGFEDRIFIPYLILGVAEMVAGLTTTSKKGVPEIQEIIATEPIHPHSVKEKTTTIHKPKIVHTKKPEVKKSNTETQKTTVIKPNADKKPSAKIASPVKKATPEIKKANPAGKKVVKK